MSKEETVRYLIGIGYRAELRDGVVIVLVPVPMQRREKEQLRNALRAIGYRGSWGWRVDQAPQEVAV